VSYAGLILHKKDQPPRAACHRRYHCHPGCCPDPGCQQYYGNANNQVDIAHARLLLVTTTIAIGMDGLGNGV
jgi:hypothetical protein